MSGNDFRELLEHVDIRSSCLFYPLVKRFLRCGFIWLMPTITSFFFHIISRGQGLIELECLLQTLALIARVIQIVRMLEQQPTNTFQNGLTQPILCFSLQIAAQLGQFFIKQLDDMKVMNTSVASGIWLCIALR